MVGFPERRALGFHHSTSTFSTAASSSQRLVLEHAEALITRYGMLAFGRRNQSWIYPVIPSKYFNISLFYRINANYLGLEGEA